MLIFPGQFVKFLTAAILSSFLIWTAACSNSAETSNVVNSSNSNQDVNNSNAISAKDDIEELGTIIKLPEMPEEVVWREEQSANPNGKKLTAVLKFNSEAAAKIVEAAAKIKPVAPAEVGTESWFPNELTAQSQLSGNESLKGIAYSADDFYNSPYQNGRLTRIDETNYFVLELTTY